MSLILKYPHYLGLNIIYKKALFHSLYFWGSFIERNQYQYQFSRSVVSNSLRPMACSMTGFAVHHQLPGLTQGTPSRWCHPGISPSVILFSSCLQSFPASGSFPMSQFFATGGQSIIASASASVLPMNI